MESIIPGMSALAIKEHLKILDMKKEVFVLYGDMFKNLRDTKYVFPDYPSVKPPLEIPKELPPNLPVLKLGINVGDIIKTQTYKIGKREDKPKEYGTAKFIKKKAIQGEEEKDSPKKPPLKLSQKPKAKAVNAINIDMYDTGAQDKIQNASKIVKKLSSELIKLKEYETPLIDAIKKHSLYENYSALCREINDFKRISELGEDVNKLALENVENVDFKDLSDAFKQASYENGEALSCFDSQRSKENIRIISEKQSQGPAKVEPNRPPLKLKCNHSWNPILALERAKSLKEKIGVGPLQFVCGTDNCSYILNDFELAHLLGGYFKTFYSNYNEQFPEVAGKLACMICTKAYHTTVIIKIHKNHVACIRCMENYISWLNQGAASSINENTLNNPNGPCLNPLKCPARSCNYKFQDNIMLQCFQTNLFYHIYEEALRNSLCVDEPSIPNYIQKKKESNKGIEGVSATQIFKLNASSKVEHHEKSPSSPQVSSKKCEICMNSFPVESLVGLYNCTHFLCETCFKM